MGPPGSNTRGFPAAVFKVPVLLAVARRWSTVPGRHVGMRLYNLSLGAVRFQNECLLPLLFVPLHRQGFHKSPAASRGALWSLRVRPTQRGKNRRCSSTTCSVPAPPGRSSGSQRTLHVPPAPRDPGEARSPTVLGDAERACFLSTWSGGR